MKAVVLAGGYATRLWPITRNIPKMLLPVGDTCVLDRQLEDLATDDRIDDVYISTNQQFANMLESHVTTQSYPTPTISIESPKPEAENDRHGTLGALAELISQENLDGEDLCIIGGDNLLSTSVSEILDAYDQQNTPLVAAYDVASRDRATEYGVLTVEGSRVTSVTEKPADPVSTLVSTACYVLPAAAVRFTEYLNMNSRATALGEYLAWLHDHHTVHAHTITGTWFDIGTPASYLAAVSWALDGGTKVADSAVVNNVTLNENVHILPGAEVYDSTLENTIVFPDARIRESSVTTALIDTNAYIRDATVENAVIGQNTEATPYE